MDIDQFLQGASPVFKKYIEDGLAELEQATGKSTDSQVNKILLENRFAAKSSGKTDADYWMERLNALKVSDLMRGFTRNNLLMYFSHSIENRARSNRRRSVRQPIVHRKFECECASAKSITFKKRGIKLT